MRNRAAKSQKRKVGLALGGGVARGLAHSAVSIVLFRVIPSILVISALAATSAACGGRATSVEEHKPPAKEEQKLEPTQEQPTTIPYTLQDLKESGELDTLLSIEENALNPGGNDHTELVKKVFEASYYEVTGYTSEEHNISIEIITEEAYKARVPDIPHLKNSSAFSFTLVNEKGAGYGVLLQGEGPTAQVLRGVAHEAGHIREVIFKEKERYEPDLICKDILYGFSEGIARQFESTIMRKIQEYIDINLLEFVDSGTNRSYIENKLKLDENRGREKITYLISWLAILDDPELKDLKRELETNKMLSVEQLLKLNDYFISIPERDRCDYINDRLSKLNMYLPRIHEIAKSRLIPDMYGKDGLNPRAGLLLP